MSKKQTGRGDTQISKEEDYKHYLLYKKNAPHATIEGFVNYFMSHDGDPPQDFVVKVRSYPEEMTFFINSLEDLLTDPSYAYDFFCATGTNLNVEPSNAKAWAEKIASAVLEQTPTLQ